MTVPTTTGEVTAKWLTEALRASGTICEAASVSAVDADIAGVGVGFMGEVGKLTLTYDGDVGDLPNKMVVKIPTMSPQVRALMWSSRVYEREHRFYQNLASKTPFRTPNVYHVTCNTSASAEEPEDYILLLEDLSAFTEGDQLAGLTLEQTKTVLNALARHHAAFWNGAGLEDAPYVPDVNGPMNLSGSVMYAVSIDAFKQVFGHTLRDEMVPVADAFGDKMVDMLNRFHASPHTLMHHDFRADNFFFTDDGGVAIIDWQTIARGGVGYDLGYLLSQNLDSALRREHEDALLRGYHETLLGHGASDYSYEQLFQDYRLGIMYGWVIPVFAVGTLDASSERAVALWTSVIERSQDAIFQHNCQEFILG